MYLIVGLGNPGAEYEKTRHNAGFLVVDRLADDVGARYWKVAGGALVAEGSYQGNDVVLVKPQSFMNTSGGPVKNVMKQYGVEADHVIVIHDELDIPPATVKVKFGGGHAGHNGLRSIMDKTQTRNWYRVRCGIGRPPGRMPVADYVLAVPRKDDAEDFAYAVEHAANAVLSLVTKGLEKTQQAFNH